MSGGVLVAWLVQLGWIVDWPAGFAGLIWVVLGLGAGRAWYRTAQGQLSWDGHFWCFQADGTLEPVRCDVHVHHHGGRALGLRLTCVGALSGHSGRPVGVQRWVWAHERACPARWLALRRAVYSPPVPVHRADAQQGRPNPVRATGSAANP